MIKIIPILFLLSIAAFAKTPEQIIEGKKRAVLMIKVREEFGSKSTYAGGGFFTDKQGHFVTNYHVLEAYLNEPKKHKIEFSDMNGDEYRDVEIIKCTNANKLDLCYGQIKTSKKIYFFDVIDKSPSKFESVAIIGHNGKFFSEKRGEILGLEKNAHVRHNISTEVSENLDSSMVQIGKYEYKSGHCLGDSGSPVFNIFTGDLAGIFTLCFNKNGTTNNKYAIDVKEIYSFIRDGLIQKNYKIPESEFYSSEVVEAPPEIGREFEKEKATGKLDN